jgi:hypothetical protein
MEFAMANRRNRRARPATIPGRKGRGVPWWLIPLISIVIVVFLLSRLS